VNISKYQLFDRIVEKSESSEWGKAVLEWEWTETYIIEEDEDPETCLCGHYPIKECCVITNKKNGNVAIVGNCCINKFMDTESDLIFQCIKRIQADITKSLNTATIEYVYAKRIITDWEYNFYKSIGKKRNLSYKQETIKIKINKNVLNRFRKGSTT